MKYYTYQEHHVFCVESGIDSCLLWKQVADLGWLPDGIYHKPDLAFNPKEKENAKKLRATPEYRAFNAAYQKEYNKKYEQTEKVRKYRREYEKRPDVVKHRKDYMKERYRRNKK